MTYTFQYLAAGRVWHASTLDSGHATAQDLADTLARLIIQEPTDEFRVWAGDAAGAPHGVAYRPLSCNPKAVAR